mmetsp:Transcript_78093/g.208802  ORF Transcript_78093/g.208802 Transcript_78093/m.208802 type:complete len:250 (-) Transcript_78093:2063-2812(-)
MPRQPRPGGYCERRRVPLLSPSRQIRHSGAGIRQERIRKPRGIVGVDIHFPLRLLRRSDHVRFLQEAAGAPPLLPLVRVASRAHQPVLLCGVVPQVPETDRLTVLTGVAHGATAESAVVPGTDPGIPPAQLVLRHRSLAELAMISLIKDHLLRSSHLLNHSVDNHVPSFSSVWNNHLLDIRESVHKSRPGQQYVVPHPDGGLILGLGNNSSDELSSLLVRLQRSTSLGHQRLDGIELGSLERPRVQLRC